MGRSFGLLAHVNKRLTFGISSYEQKAFPLAKLLEIIPNTFRRTFRHTLVIGIPVTFYYGLLNFALKENILFNRKNPEDFANDK